jgi:hypothetical protein
MTAMRRRVTGVVSRVKIQWLEGPEAQTVLLVELAELPELADL